jgi:hypothetical protein
MGKGGKPKAAAAEAAPVQLTAYERAKANAGSVSLKRSLTWIALRLMLRCNARQTSVMNYLRSNSKLKRSGRN